MRGPVRVSRTASDEGGIGVPQADGPTAVLPRTT